MLRLLKSLRLLLLGVALIVPTFCQVRVWQDNQIIPTYEETLPDPWPPFYAFAPADASVYPYTMRTGLTKKRKEHAWRALHLENEYLSCVMLPDLGGQIYSCKDRLSGQEMFHHNSVIKKGPIGLRGAWAAMGLEMNFPSAHSWISVSPIDFATSQNPDGSASVWVGNIDRVDGMQWRVEFVLRPGSTLLEQNVFLYNRSDVRHRYNWWDTAGIALVDYKTRIILPTNIVSSHGGNDTETWPINSAGVDLSLTGNYTGHAAWFAHDSREPFMAVYHPTLRAGVAHFADVADVPGKKFWTWGREGDKTAITDVTDDSTSYIEIQAGVTENQETYALLQPDEYKKFSEYWMPARGLDGISRANREGILNLSRSPNKGGDIQLLVEFNANRKVAGARIVVTDGKSTVLQESLDLDPATTFSKTITAPAQARYTVQILDGAGHALLTHTEGTYDAAPSVDQKIGPHLKPGRIEKTGGSAADFVDLGTNDELQGLPGQARHDYQSGLKQFPDDRDLNRALGRFEVTQNRFEEAETLLLKARTPADAELHYYLGLAYFRLSADDKAKQELEPIAAEGPWYPAALLLRAMLLSRAKDQAGALKLVETALAEQPDSIAAGAMEVTLLRITGQTEKAKRELARFQKLDPTDSGLRYERSLLGGDDPSLWPHLGADPDRVLTLATSYMDLALYDDALALLSRKFPPPPDSMASEPGSLSPQHHPLVVYYRAYCLTQLGRPAKQDLEEASGYLTEFVFPSRPLTFAVLQSALKQNPADGTALFLLGELYMSSEMVDQAIAAWRQSVSAGFKKMEIYRVLGRALLELKHDRPGALAVYQQGLKIAPNDPIFQKGVQELFGSVGKPASNAEAAEKITPAHAAAAALGLAAEGNLKEAMAAFDPATFKDEKQDIAIREAYFQIQVDQVLALGRLRKCPDAFAAEDALGNEDPKLPFTFRGFGQFLRGARIQFELASLEAMCGNPNGAKKIWTKIAKSSKDLSDPDFPLPLVSAAKVAPDSDVKPRIEAALDQLAAALSKTPANRATLLYSRGMLLRALKREQEAQAAFAEVVGADPPPLVAYLAIKALRTK